MFHNLQSLLDMSQRSYNSYVLLLHLGSFRIIESVFINLRSAECVCSYYGLRVCSQTNKLN